MEMGFSRGSESQMAEKRMGPYGNPQMGVSTGGTVGKGDGPVSISIMVLRNPNVPRPPDHGDNAWAMPTVLFGWTLTLSPLCPPLFP